MFSIKGATNRIEQLNQVVDARLDEYGNQAKQLEEQIAKGKYSNLMEKVDAMCDTMNKLEQDVKERTSLRLKHINQMEWKRLLANDNWESMEHPRQLSTEYFDNPDIKSVILLYQLDKETEQDVIRESSCAEEIQNGLPYKFYLGIVNGHKELILSEPFFDHELFYFSRDATSEYDISCSTLKEIAGHIHDYEDVISLTVDEKHLNHESRQTVYQVNDSYDAAIEEVIEAAEIPEPEFEMEM